MGKITSKATVLCNGDSLIDDSVSSEGTLRFSVWNEKKISAIFKDRKSTCIQSKDVLENWLDLAEVEYDPENTSLEQIYQNTASLSVLRLMVEGMDNMIHEHNVDHWEGPFSVGVFGTNKCCHHLEILKTIIDMVREKNPTKEFLAVFNSTAEEIWDPADAKIIEQVQSIENCELSFQGIYSEESPELIAKSSYSSVGSTRPGRMSVAPRMTINWNNRTSIHVGKLNHTTPKDKRDATIQLGISKTRVKLSITWAVMQHRFEWNADFEDNCDDFKTFLDERSSECPTHGLLILVVQTSISPAYDLIRFLVHLFAKSGKIFPEQARRHFKINQWLRKRSDITDIFEDSDIASKWALDMHEEKKVHDPFKTLHEVEEITSEEYIDLCERSLKDMCEQAFEDISDMHGMISESDKKEFWKAVRKYANGDLARIDCTHTEQHLLLRRLKDDADGMIGVGAGLLYE